MKKNILVTLIALMALVSFPMVCSADTGTTTSDELQVRILAGESRIAVYTEKDDGAAELIREAVSMDCNEAPVYEEPSSKGDYLREAVLHKVDVYPGTITWDAEKGCYRTTLFPSYRMNKEQLAYVDKTVKAVAARCAGMSTPDKVRFFCDWLAVHVSYAETESVYYALTEGKGRCREYAVLLYLLCKEAGIDARTVSGFSGDMLHEWNVVMIDGMWYHVDPTFYDTFGLDARYILRGSNAVKRNLTEPYTDAGFAERYPISGADYARDNELAALPSAAILLLTAIAPGY